MTQYDEILRARFRALGSAEARSAPPFGLPVARPPGSARARRFAPAAALLIALGGGAVVRGVFRAGAAPYAIDLSAVSWTAPTDFLLQTPGADLFRTLPTIETGAANAPSGAPNTIDTVERTRT